VSQGLRASGSGAGVIAGTLPLAVVVTRRNAHRHGLRDTILKYVDKDCIYIMENHKDADLSDESKDLQGFMSAPLQQAKSQVFASTR
jgi:hypothetical protein